MRGRGREGVQGEREGRKTGRGREGEREQLGVLHQSTNTVISGRERETGRQTDRGRQAERKGRQKERQVDNCFQLI